jgi:hypothetical protein
VCTPCERDAQLRSPAPHPAPLHRLSVPQDSPAAALSPEISATCVCQVHAVASPGGSARVARASVQVRRKTDDPFVSVGMGTCSPLCVPIRESRMLLRPRGFAGFLLWARERFLPAGSSAHSTHGRSDTFHIREGSERVPPTVGQLARSIPSGAEPARTYPAGSPTRVRHTARGSTHPLHRGDPIGEQTSHPCMASSSCRPMIIAPLHGSSAG